MITAGAAENLSRYQAVRAFESASRLRIWLLARLLVESSRRCVAAAFGNVDVEAAVYRRNAKLSFASLHADWSVLR